MTWEPNDVLVYRAREACACIACVGGYPLGAHTIQMGVGELRPSSCLAAVLLAELVRERVEIEAGFEKEEEE